MPAYSEPDLILPALTEIARHADGVTTDELQRVLRSALRPEGADLAPLARRRDDRFSQKVRNLKSHDALARRGLATYDENTQKYYITEEGRRFVEIGVGVMEALTKQGFSQRQCQGIQNRNFDNVTIEEGSYRELSSRVIERSQQLRAAAVQYFADENGSIECKGCGFRSEAIYGGDAKGLIEIHHTRPLSVQGGQAAHYSMRVALQGVVPLCPSCHRMIHFKQGNPISIAELVQRVVDARNQQSC